MLTPAPCCTPRAQIFEKKPDSVKNFGIWIRYNSRTDPVNMYKEYRDTTLCGAIAQMYLEMAGRHRARASSVQVQPRPACHSLCNLVGPIAVRPATRGRGGAAVARAHGLPAGGCARSGVPVLLGTASRTWQGCVSIWPPRSGSVLLC